MKPVGKALFLALLLYSFLHLGYSVLRYNAFSGISSGDFNRVYQEATYWVRSATYSPDGVWHPPFYYWLLITLDRWLGGQQNLIYFFYFLQFLLFPWAIHLLVQSVRAPSSRFGFPVLYGASAILVLNFQPLLETLAQHKVEGIEFFLICLAIWAFRREKDGLCGAAVVLATNLKFLPGILLLYFLVKREWKVLWGAAAGMGILLMILIFSFSAQTLRSGLIQQPMDQLFSHRLEGTSPNASVEMQTLTGMVNRWLAKPKPPTSFMEYITRGSYMPVPQAKLAQALSVGLRLLLLAGWLALIRHRWRRTERQARWSLFLLEISVTLVMILVVSQAARVHYGILLLPGFVILGLLLLQQSSAFHLTEKLLFFVGYGLSAMVVPGGLLNRLPPHPMWGTRYSQWYLWWSLPMWGYLLLGLCAVLCWKRAFKRGTAA